jgi:hypothetical protein
MDKETQIKNQLENKLFQRFSKTVTFKKPSTPTYNDRGEIVSIEYTESSIRLVNYNITSEEDAKQRWGEWVPGDQEAVIPYDVVVDVDDLITIRGVDYIVKNIRQPELPGVLVNIVHLRKKLD